MPSPGAANGVVVLLGELPQRGVDQELDVARDQEVDRVGPPLVDLEHLLRLDPLGAKVLGGPLGGEDLHPELRETPRDRHHVRLVVVVDGDEHPAGERELAASSLSISLFGLMMWCFSGLTGMVAALIAAELGRRRHAVREVRRSARMALWLSVLCGFFGMTVCWFGREIMLVTGQEPHIAELAGGFLRVIMWAMVPMIAMKELGIPHEKLNVNGGACALGHPIGASGTRIITTLIAALQNRGVKKGVASLCIGGGEATAMAVELI